MKSNRENTRAWLMSGLFGILTGAFLVLGYQLEKLDRIDLSDRNSMMVMVMLMMIVTVDSRYVWRGYDVALTGRKLFGFITLPKYIDNDAPGKRDFLVNWVLMILLSIPVFMAEFPGFFVYDAQDELNEVLTRTFTTHHPLFHVLLLGGTIALLHKISGSWNLAIFGYLFLQMLVITAIFAYAVTYMQKKGIGKKSRILWVLFYGAFPTIVMYTLCSCKDSLFMPVGAGCRQLFERQKEGHPLCPYCHTDASFQAQRLLCVSGIHTLCAHSFQKTVKEPYGSHADRSGTSVPGDLKRPAGGP